MLKLPETEVIGLLEWIEDTMKGRCRVWGIWCWEIREFTTTRLFKGLVIYFSNAIDAVHFQLMWTDSYQPVFGDLPASAYS